VRTLNKKRDAHNERGVSLIVALLALLVISMLTAGLILVTQTEIWTTASYRELAQARYAAEAGVQNTINFLQYTYVAPTNFASYTMTSNPVSYNGNPVVLSAISSIASNYPDATQQTAFQTALSSQALPGLGNASYSTSAKLLSMKQASGVSWLGAGGGAVQTWQITSQGTINGVRSATVQVVATYTRTGSPLFNYPIEATSAACGSITFSRNGSLTDSYDSNNGPYSVTNSSTTGGNLATNGNVNLGSGVTVDGIIYAPNTTLPRWDYEQGHLLGRKPAERTFEPATPLGLLEPTVLSARNRDDRCPEREYVLCRHRRLYAKRHHYSLRWKQKHNCERLYTHTGVLRQHNPQRSRCRSRFSGNVQHQQH
jgi:Tfp pilus assembly protein PilX